MLDRHGKVLAYYYSRGIDRVPVRYEQISPVMRQAIVAIEDSRFYQHGALDFKGTLRAIINNLEHKPVQGGSTLAQQYVKNVLYLSAYNPINDKQTVLSRRNVVLQRMVQVGDITQAQADAAGRQPLGLNVSAPQKGCTSRSVRYAAYFCDYVLASMKRDPEFRQAWKRLNGIGGLKIYTTLDPADQHAAQRAVNYMMPPPPSPLNPGRNAAAEVLIEPGSGRVRAMAIDRPYGSGKHRNTVNYAVGPQYHGGQGVQIGSTGKVYVMVAALEQGIPFGYSKNVGFSATVGGYTNCKGQPLPPWKVHNDESEKGGHYTLYTGTTFSINVWFAYLEQKVGLCNVVHTAAKMGLTWPNGKSLLKADPKERHWQSADNLPSFTLGAANVAPIDVAAADAVLPARGIYCHPVAISKIVTTSGT